MRTGAAAGHDGYLHEALLYGTDEELLATAVPFLEGGRAAGEPTLAILGERTAALVREALGDTSGIEFVDGSHYDRPVAAIRAYDDLFRASARSGATQIRAIGEMPGAVMAHGVWEPWARYEAAINRAFRDLPLWGICAYDTRVAPPEVRADVACTHPQVVTAAGGRGPSADYLEPAAFLRGRPPVADELAPPRRPDLELVDPDPAAARHAVGSLATGLGPDRALDLVTAVSEAVTNGLRHGRPPVRVRAWSDAGQVIVAVSDRGPGPVDPLAGLVPPQRAPGEGGLGLWISHQVCDRVLLSPGPIGFTVWLVAGVREQLAS